MADIDLEWTATLVSDPVRSPGGGFEVQIWHEHTDASRSFAQSYRYGSEEGLCAAIVAGIRAQEPDAPRKRRGETVDLREPAREAVAAEG